MTYTIVGVIGHIDHGKTSLVAALTGVDTDTHPEEKRRGITIDLGFASFRQEKHQFALIDAPGHQKYIGNLLAGVSAIDIGLLVVACDQGIQAQTLEHAGILQTLGVRNLVVALSRIDLASAEAQEELRSELELFLDDFGFHDIPMIPISAPQKIGLPQLQQQLVTIAKNLPPRVTGSFFRMPIDRVFTMEGRGCVVAGTVWSGQTKLGDTLQLASSGKEVRVREIEIHSDVVTQSEVGHRTALNITGVSANDIHRGDELLASEAFRPTKHLLIEVQTFRNTPEIKCPAVVQLHISATACEGRITGIRKLTAGMSAVVLIEAEHSVVASFGQRCLLRLPYPVGTIAGGTVLAALENAGRRSRKLIEFGEQLAMAEAEDRLFTWVDYHKTVQADQRMAELQLGITEDLLLQSRKKGLDENRLAKLKSGQLASVAALNQLQDAILKRLQANAENSNDSWQIEESFRSQLTDYGTPELISATVERLVQSGKIVRLGRMITVGTEDSGLSKKQQKRLEQIVAHYEGDRTPATLKDVATQLQIQSDSAKSLSRFAIQMGLLVDLDNGLQLTTSVFQQLVNELQSLLQETPVVSVADIRDHWQVTRKHAIPFLEYCDSHEYTIRDTDGNRSAGPKLRQGGE